MKGRPRTQTSRLERLTWQHYAMIAILAFTAYAPTLRVGFLWDDHVIIEHNPWIRQWSWDAVRHDFLSDNTQGRGDDYYRPLQAVTHRMDYSLWGLRPFGFHLMDLFFHVAAGLLLVQFVMALGFPAMTAFLTGCLFVVHPGGVEQFLVASGCTTPISYAFMLLSLLLLLQNENSFALGLGVLSFACGLFTKEIAIITPAMVALAFWYKRIPARRAAVLIPMALVAGVYLLLRHRVVHIPGGLNPSFILLFFSHVFPRILVHYVALILWPWNLHSHRLIPHLTHAWPLYWLGWIGLTAGVVRAKNRTGLFCIAWLILSLLPTTVAMISGGFMLDHWSYVANVAVLLPLAMLFNDAWENPRTWFRQGVILLFFPFIIVWALFVHLNVQLRGTDEKIFRWALHFTTSAPIKSNLGIVLLQTHRPAEALPYLLEVRALYPEDINNNLALAEAYDNLGRHKFARLLREELARQNPAFSATEPAVHAIICPLPSSS